MVGGGVVVVGGLQHFCVSPRPLGFGFGTKRFGAKGLGPGLDNFNLPDVCCFVWINPWSLIVPSINNVNSSFLLPIFPLIGIIPLKS